uniref:proline-rich protein, Y-linked-like n=1 Tax=Macaca mulatta TaxID=9544 RepID=UPI0010A20F54|nr:proline-rich protein, Y-linked-like [Macaca mulatta]
MPSQTPAVPQMRWANWVYVRRAKVGSSPRRLNYRVSRSLEQSTGEERMGYAGAGHTAVPRDPLGALVPATGNSKGTAAESGKGGTWMQLETIILSKLSQEQKTKHHMFSLMGGN